MFLEIILIGLILSSDSFSAAVAMGSRPFTKKDAAKFVFSSSLAEGLFTLFGAFAGEKIISRFQAIDHWIAFGILLAVALHMAYEAICDLSKKEKPEQKTFHGILKILLVSCATSLDAFGVGIGLGLAQKPIVPYIFSIALWAAIATIAGLYLAKIIPQKFVPFLTLFGAVILGILAFEMLKI